MSHDGIGRSVDGRFQNKFIAGISELWTEAIPDGHGRDEVGEVTQQGVQSFITELMN